MQERIKKLIQIFSVESKNELFILWIQNKPMPMPNEYIKIERLLEAIKKWEEWKEKNETNFNNFKELQKIWR